MSEPTASIVSTLTDAGEGERVELLPEKLTPHPKNAEIYGGPDPSERFIEDVRENGIKKPIVVTEDSHFVEGEATVTISGHERVESASRTDQTVPVGEHRTFDSPEEEIAAVLRYNDYRDKSFSQRMGEADAIHGIEERAAAERIENPLQNFAEGEGGLSRDRIAERVGLGSGETYRKARKVWDAAQEGDLAAEGFVHKLDAGEESIHEAYTAFRDTDSFETSGRVGDLLDDLVADGQLTERNVAGLKAAAPPTVLGYLAREYDLHPFADGTRPGWRPLVARGGDGEGEDSKKKIAHYERGEVPIDRIQTPASTSMHSADRPLGINKRQVGLLAQAYRKGVTPTTVNVAVSAAGEYALLNPCCRTSIEAHRVTGTDVPVTVVNVDGTDDSALVEASCLIGLIDSSTTKPIGHSEAQETVSRIAEEDPELAKIIRQLLQLQDEMDEGAKELTVEGDG